MPVISIYTMKKADDELTGFFVILQAELHPDKVTETVYAHIPAAHKQEAMDKLPY